MEHGQKCFAISSAAAVTPQSVSAIGNKIHNLNRDRDFQPHELKQGTINMISDHHQIFSYNTSSKTRVLSML